MREEIHDLIDRVAQKKTNKEPSYYPIAVYYESDDDFARWAAHIKEYDLDLSTWKERRESDEGDYYKVKFRRVEGGLLELECVRAGPLPGSNPPEIELTRSDLKPLADLDRDQRKRHIICHIA